MKLIEAMKKIKENKEKIVDLQKKISENCAHLNIETPLYPDAEQKVTSWAQSCEDLNQENIHLLTSIQRTNLQTQVSIVLGEKTVTKCIAEWVWRRREYAAIDYNTYMKMTDRGLSEGKGRSSTGVDLDLKIVRKYNPETRDKKIAMFKSEPHMIDAKLEVINAITDLIES
jgi:hypothetical protein